MVPQPTAPHMRKRPYCRESAREATTVLSASTLTGAPSTSVANMQARIDQKGPGRGSATRERTRVPRWRGNGQAIRPDKMAQHTGRK